MASSAHLIHSYPKYLGLTTVKKCLHQLCLYRIYFEAHFSVDVSSPTSVAAECRNTPRCTFVSHLRTCSTTSAHNKMHTDLERLCSESLARLRHWTHRALKQQGPEHSHAGCLPTTQTGLHTRRRGRGRETPRMKSAFFSRGRSDHLASCITNYF